MPDQAVEQEGAADEAGASHGASLLILGCEPDPATGAMDHSYEEIRAAALDVPFTRCRLLQSAYGRSAIHQSRDREEAYVLLNLFILYCRKMYQLMDELGK
jgi:hypothetical protein